MFPKGLVIKIWKIIKLIMTVNPLQDMQQIAQEMPTGFFLPCIYT